MTKMTRKSKFSSESEIIRRMVDEIKNAALSDLFSLTDDPYVFNNVSLTVDEIAVLVDKNKDSNP